MIQRFLRRVIDRGGVVFVRADDVNRGGVRNCIADVFVVHRGDIPAAEEVDELFRAGDVARVRRDADGIIEDVAAFFRHDVIQLVVLAHAEGRVAAPNHRDGRLARDHLVLDLVHDVGQHHRLLLDEQVLRVLQIGRIGGVEVVPRHHQRNRQRVARGVEHQHVHRVGRIHQRIPAGRRFIHHLRVVEDAHRTPSVRHGVFALRVVALVHKARIDVGDVGNVFPVDLLEQVLLNHALDHVVAGDNHVVARTAHRDFGVHVLVRFKRLIDDLDAGLLLEQVEHFRLDVVAPVVDADGFLRRQRKERAERQRGGKQQHGEFLHV